MPAQRHARPSHAAGHTLRAGLTPQRTEARQYAPVAKSSRSRYIPALDGIRTFAVIAVVLYHLGFTWAQGGFQGVTVFFVLSGYLITRLLRIEFAQSGTIDLKSFWVRRVRRLVPATITLIVVVAILCALFNHVMLTKMRPDILPSLLFFNNWWQILHNVSYFGALGDPSPLTHFWSLAIEEQFYVVWPVLLFVLLRFGARRRQIRIVVLVLAVASAVSMAVLYTPLADPSRVYYGTDTRAFSMLIGALLAFLPGIEELVPRDGAANAGQGIDEAHRGLAPRAHALPPIALDAAGALSFACFVFITVCTNGYTPFAYEGGTVVVSLLAAVLIAACVQEDGLLARVFGLAPLVWLGQRSYSIYLWHFPLFALMNPVSDVSTKPWWAYLIQCAIVLAVSCLSYRFIETPFRKGAFGSFLELTRERGFSMSAYLRLRAVPAACAALLVMSAAGALALVPDTSAMSKEGAALLEGSDDASQQDGKASSDAEEGKGSDGDAEGGGKDDAAANGDAGGEAGAPKTDEYGFPVDAYDVLWIGDSVSLYAEAPFYEEFPEGHIDPMKNRQFYTAEELFQEYERQGLAGRIVVFALGTNGNVTDDAIDSLMKVVGEDRIVVFVNIRCPEGWVESTNAAYARAAERYDNVVVVDWHGYSEGRNDLFDGDGTHPTVSGAEEYVALVKDAIEPYLPYQFDDEEQAKLTERMDALIEKASQVGAASLASGAQPEGE